MKKRRRRQKRTSVVSEVFHFILAIALIVVAVFVVLFVIGKIRGITGSFWNKPLKPTGTETGIEISNETEAPETGFYEDAAGRVQYRKEDGSLAKDEWVEADQALYYINPQGFVETGAKTIEGMRYSFASDGKLKSIRYAPNYQPDRATVIGDYPSLVRSKKIWAFLSDSDTRGHFSALMYKKTTDAMAYQLGGTENPQYTGPYSMQIDGDYIYFLPLTDAAELTDEESGINGKLYRMKPGDTVRQIVARNVEGYKVVNGTVYYEANGSLHRSTGAMDDTEKNAPKQASSDEALHIEIEDGAAYAVDGGGNPITSPEGELKGRGFTYYLREDGTIRDVNQKTSVNTGGYTYFVEGDTAFGASISRVMRRGADGTEEVISSEFAGSVGNLRYDYGTGNILAEYTDASGMGRIIRITKSGDVDVLQDNSAGTGALKLIAIQDGTAIGMKPKEGGDSFTVLSLQELSPLAVGVDPVKRGSEDGTEDGSAKLSDQPAEPAGTEGAAKQQETKASGQKESVSKPEAPKGNGAVEAPQEPNTTAAFTGPEQVVIGGAPE